tara:strand:+ start:1837 stop:2211 length:375 start_codon:yes stop_codon:yes gene_type:complete
MTRRSWTYPELAEAADRFASGESWQTIGETYGVSGCCVRTLVKRHGLKKERQVQAPRPTDRHVPVILRAIALRNRDAMAWPTIAETVDWEQSWNHLRTLCLRYGSENRCRVKTGYPENRKRRTA